MVVYVVAAVVRVGEHVAVVVRAAVAVVAAAAAAAAVVSAAVVAAWAWCGVRVCIGDEAGGCVCGGGGGG